METLIYNQDYPPIKGNISNYLDCEYHSQKLKLFSVFPDENYRWELIIMDKKVIIETEEEKSEVKLLLKLMKKYIN